MWQILTITLISLGVVSCDTNCPGFSYYQNDPLLLDVKCVKFMFFFCDLIDPFIIIRNFTEIT